MALHEGERGRQREVTFPLQEEREVCIHMEGEQLPYPDLAPVVERGFNMQVALDLFSFVYFSMELVIKVAALGLSGYNGSYLSNNWNKFDTTAVALGIHHINISVCMQDMVMILLDTLPMLVNVLVLYMFVMFIFAIVGVQLWAGKLRNRCFLGVDIPENSSGWLNPYYVSKYDERSPFICSYDHSNGMRRCHDVPPYIRDEETCSLAVPNHSSAANKFLVPGAAANACVNWNSYYNICRAGDHNPNMGVTSFDNIGHALIVLFQVVTLEGWTDILFFVMDAHSFWSFIFFMLVTIVSSNLS
uniref:Ion transport domain-containing protein n=1 Tax=Seriola lalandi dorsalis TaxID=1841481 RepID=A0A3B4X2K4_SERLL